jgi:hypothetical protein
MFRDLRSSGSGPASWQYYQKNFTAFENQKNHKTDIKANGREMKTSALRSRQNQHYNEVKQLKCGLPRPT